jgi:hypothetical protein
MTSALRAFATCTRCWQSLANAARGVLPHPSAVPQAPGHQLQKKTCSRQDRPDIARRRAWWRRHQSKIDPARLVFIDETWAKTRVHIEGHPDVPEVGHGSDDISGDRVIPSRKRLLLQLVEPGQPPEEFVGYPRDDCLFPGASSSSPRWRHFLAIAAPEAGCLRRLATRRPAGVVTSRSRLVPGSMG